MSSKAAKLKQKRTSRSAGRPRKEGFERYPSGKIKPSETEKETQSVVIGARKRLNGWEGKTADVKAKDPRAGYTLGVLFLDGKITEDQLEAGDEYALAIARYHRITGIPFPSARAQTLFSIKGHDGELTDSMNQRIKLASDKMMALQSVLLQCVDGPQVKTLIHNLCVMDYENLRGMGSQQMLWIRRGLTALRDCGILQTHNKSATTDIVKSEVFASA